MSLTAKGETLPIPARMNLDNFKEIEEVFHNATHLFFPASRRIGALALHVPTTIKIEHPVPRDISKLDVYEMHNRSFVFMTDADIAQRVSRMPGAVGVTARHQYMELMAKNPQAPVKEYPLYTLTESSFVIGALEENVPIVKDLLEQGKVESWGENVLTFVTEYMIAARHHVTTYGGYSARLLHCDNDAEIEPSLFPEEVDGVVAIMGTGDTFRRTKLHKVALLGNVELVAVVNTSRIDLSVI